MLEQCGAAIIETASSLTLKSREDPLAHLDDVVRYAYARLGSREEAEDVAMEVFQAAFRFRSELTTKTNPSLYLIGITRRKIADHLRNRRKQRGANTISLNDPSLSDIHSPPSESLTELMQALETLPELQRDVLVLKYLVGLSINEVAQVIRKSPQAANSLLQRARESLSKNAPHLLPDSSGERRKL